MYELKLEKFTGPLEKLLELIEERKLDITEISLAQVTDDFLKYLKSLSEAHTDLRLIADFLAVASRLVLIKSKSLLPDFSLTPEEESGIKDLEKRLKFYQEFKSALRNVAGLWSGKKTSFGRPYFLEINASAGVFYPGENFELQAIIAEIENLFQSIKRFEIETETIKEKIITIEEKIEEIMQKLRNGAEESFANLSEARSRSEAIAIFLALLHLAREQLVFLEQVSGFSDIIIKKHDAHNT